MKTVKKVVVTGGLGNLGRVMVPALLGSEYELWLVVRKGKGGVSAKERVLSVFGPKIARLVHVIESDVLDIGSLDLGFHPDLIFHSAGSVKFGNPSCLDTNYLGAKAVAEFAERNGYPKVVFVSTAYVSGKGSRLPERIFPQPEVIAAYEALRSEYKKISDLDFKKLIACFGASEVYGLPRNFYEASKQLVELFIASLLEKKEWQGKIFVLRPSIITNSGSDGYHGYHGLVWLVLKWLESQWDKNPGRLREAGIFFENGEWILPITLRMSMTSTLNLIPADWTARTMASLCEKIMVQEVSHNVFNVAHPNPPWMRDVVGKTLPEMGIRGATVSDVIPQDVHPVIAFIQGIMEYSLDPFYPYILQEGVFPSDNSQTVLGESFEVPRVIDQGVLSEWIRSKSGLAGNFNYSSKRIQGMIDFLNQQAVVQFGW